MADVETVAATTSEINLPEDDGLITVTMGGASNQIDLYDVNNLLFAAAHEFEGKPTGEYHARVKEIIAKLGFPSVSTRLADMFVAGINAQMARLKKKDSGETTAASPGSTASTPSPETQTAASETSTS